MAITTATAAAIVHGADHAIHATVKGAMLRHARIVRETAGASEYHLRWARQVLAGNDGSYPAILRELSLRQAIQDLYIVGSAQGFTGYDEAQAGAVRSNLAAILDAAIAAALG